MLIDSKGFTRVVLATDTKGAGKGGKKDDYVLRGGASMELKEELEYFVSVKEDLLKHHRNQYVLIKGKGLVGTYSTFEEAFNDGVKQLGNVPFLVRQVQEKDEVVQFPALAVGAINAHS